MKRNKFRLGLLVVIGSIATCPLGCRQGANPNMAMPPMNLLTPQTRVPAPATGSYSVPGGYYQGQASTQVPSPSGTQVAGLSNPATNSGTNPNTGLSNQAIGSGVAPTPTTPTPLPLWTEQSPRYGSVSPASYQPAANPQVAGFPSTSPTPAVGYVSTLGPSTSSAVDAGLRPQMRGMQVVDLTRSDKPSTEMENWVPPIPDPLQQISQDQPASQLQAINQLPNTNPSSLQPATRTDSASLPWRSPLQ